MILYTPCAITMGSIWSARWRTLDGGFYQQRR
jgi:hypothetical protein